ncbi:MAG: M20/M25/M40 family metallo-hydrolase [Actinomycetia bacterium]|nr:M20/M25/M40 family metallo-hydrolase [Actinomycetes bacterium]MCP4961039.1 M20/M25/M40 family metallo-hydrolase [Actinomycetes bacterium]
MSLADQTVDLLQTLIRNECVNDGSPESGHEVRNADVLQTFIEGSGVDVERYEASKGRVSLVARVEGTDPDAPSLCLMGHTDVVPVNPDGWERDPFGGELVDGEVWGRGALDMLNLTSAQAVAFRDLVDRGVRPRGDLVYFAVADEESGSHFGAQWMADNHRDAIYADYVMTESGGVHSGSPEAPSISINVAEKGVAWRRLRVKGTPGHGSMPFRSDNALLKAGAVMKRLSDYRPTPQFHELWRAQIGDMSLPEDAKNQLLDEDRIDDFLTAVPNRGAATHWHSCTHTTFSVNAARGAMKTNVIPDTIDLEVDIRTMPGESTEEVQAHLDAALGDLAGDVEVVALMNDVSTISPTDTRLWDSIQRAVAKPFERARLSPQFSVGFTDARVYRQMGAVAYGTGLFSPEVKGSDFASRFHGHNERIDVESLRLTTQMYVDVLADFWR